MSIGGSIFLIAVGAILRYAVTATVAGVDIQTVGIILMVAGAIGLAISLFMYFQNRQDQPPGGGGYSGGGNYPDGGTDQPPRY